jgi:hypothetical protein
MLISMSLLMCRDFFLICLFVLTFIPTKYVHKLQNATINSYDSDGRMNSSYCLHDNTDTDIQTIL